MRYLSFAFTLAVLPAVMESEVRAESGQWPQAERAQLEKILLENIVPFWYPATVPMPAGSMIFFMM